MLYYYEKRYVKTVDVLVRSQLTIHSYSLDGVTRAGDIYGGLNCKMVTENNGVAYTSSANVNRNSGINGVFYKSDTGNIFTSAPDLLVVEWADSPTSVTYLLLRGTSPVSQSKFKVRNIVQDYPDRLIGSIYKASKAPGSLVSEFISEEGMYPDDGVQGDYWYVKKGRAINFKYKDINGIVYDIAEAKYKDVNGNIVDIASAIYKDNNGNILS